MVKAKSAREAEMAKLLENTYRHVNIALVNEMAIFCHELGVDLWDAIRCAATKPFGFQAFYPGPGVGGHCIPIDPNYLSYKVRAELKLPVPLRRAGAGDQLPDARLRRRPRRRAAQHRRQAAERRHGAAARRHLQEGHRRPAGVSPARPIARKLLQRGAALSYHDPYVDSWQVDGTDIPRAASPADAGRPHDPAPGAHRATTWPTSRRTPHLLFDTRGKISGDSVYPL